MSFWDPLWLTFKLALVTTIILLVISIPFAWWLSTTKWKIKPLIEALVSMPLVLPPTVLGFYLLIALSPNSTLGNLLLQWFDVRLVFSFPGLVFASLIYSLPFMVQPLYAGFKKIPPQLKEASYMLGKSSTTTLFKVLLPNMKASVLTGIVLCFAHTVGEFGVVLMIGGNIPGKTRVASIAIYDLVERMDYEAAGTLSFILVVTTFTILVCLYFFNGGYSKSTIP
ncbi:molybdate ABC transporter permease subunit [Ascidiimonas sp. W6]|uniref:molybdate ABC transporter permease subunit n=1 Tax=Ascidiimonas meishanensis TaxID=3128903 RepID=UPI0030EDEDBD